MPLYVHRGKNRFSFDVLTKLFLSVCGSIWKIYVCRSILHFRAHLKKPVSLPTNSVTRYQRLHLSTKAWQYCSKRRWMFSSRISLWVSIIASLIKLRAVLLDTYLLLIIFQFHFLLLMILSERLLHLDLYLPPIFFRFTQAALSILLFWFFRILL